MGMGFSIIVQPDELGEEPPNIEYCDNQGLVASNATGGGSSSGRTDNCNAFGNCFISTIVMMVMISIISFS
jgi:hypothetical protein